MNENTPRSGKKISILAWVATLYYGQGLPFSLVRQVSVVFFRDQGAQLSSLGLVSLFGIPWTFKFLWGPFIDSKFTKKRWILMMEVALALALGAVSLSVLTGLTSQIIAGVFFLVAIFSATHDIAIDGYYLEALDKQDQAKYSGLWQAGYRLALVTGSGVLVALSAKFKWWQIFGATSLFFLILMSWHSLILPPSPAQEKKFKAVPIVEGFYTFLQLPNIGLALAFFLLFKVGDALLFAMSTPFLLDSGLTKQDLGLISGVFGTFAGIIASILGGWFISRFTLRRGLIIFGIIQNFAIPVYALVSWLKPGVWGFAVAVVVEQVSAGLGSSAYANFAMRQINPKFRATHYAIATGIMALTTTLSGVLSGFGAQKYGYTVFFMMAFAASVPGLVLIPFVARRPECAT